MDQVITILLSCVGGVLAAFITIKVKVAVLEEKLRGARGRIKALEDGHLSTDGEIKEIHEKVNTISTDTAMIKGMLNSGRYGDFGN